MTHGPESSPPPEGSDHAVVIGGGVIGAACAYYLARDGWRVSVLEKHAFGRGCSHGNCGFICPSHVLPLTTPGAFATALFSLLRPTAPFRIKPRFDPGLWWWLLKFARRCNTAQMLRAAGPIHALLNSSRELYDRLFDEEPFTSEWETRGVLFAFQTLPGLEHHARTAKLLQDRYGVLHKRYSASELCELEPALKPGLAGGFCTPRTPMYVPTDLCHRGGGSWKKKG